MVDLQCIFDLHDDVNDLDTGLSLDDFLVSCFLSGTIVCRVFSCSVWNHRPVLDFDLHAYEHN